VHIVSLHVDRQPEDFHARDRPMTNAILVPSLAHRSCKCTRCTLGDFVFDNVDEYNEYLALINDYQSSQSEVTTPLTSPELDSPASFKVTAAVSKPKHKHSHSHSHSSTIAPALPLSSSSSAAKTATGRPGGPTHIALPSMKSLPQPRLESRWSDDSDDEDDLDDDFGFDSSSPSSEDEIRYTNQRWERALEFASWRKNADKNEWVAPSGVATNYALRKLVRMVQ